MSKGLNSGAKKGEDAEVGHEIVELDEDDIELLPEGESSNFDLVIEQGLNQMGDKLNSAVRVQNQNEKLDENNFKRLVIQLPGDIASITSMVVNVIPIAMEEKLALEVYTENRRMILTRKDGDQRIGISRKLGWMLEQWDHKFE